MLNSSRIFIVDLKSKSILTELFYGIAKSLDVKQINANKNKYHIVATSINPIE